MKKRRVLALFLALSMALSSNGFTALAAEQDSVGAIEAGLSEGTDDTDGESSASDADDENGNNASESEDGAQDNTGENGNDAGESGDSSEDNGETGSGENEDDALLENGEDESDVDVSDEEDVLGDAESENELQVVDNASENAGSAEVRMYTFTDETGMQVTYDLNEKLSYKYTIEDHVLTSVTKKNADGTEEALTGVVELEQQTSDKSNAQYYTTISESVFSGNKKITYVILPEGVKFIGEDKDPNNGAFEDCTELKGIDLPVTLTSIGDSAFKGCTKLTQLSIPKAVTSIGNSAFEGDSSLFMVYIKDYEYSSMTSIGDEAFKNCSKLERFGSDAEFVLPGYLVTIGAYAFEKCYSIKKVTLPDSVKDQKQSDGSIKKGLGDGAFINCTGMTDLALSGVETISEEAFSGCINLLSVKFVNGNKVIEDSAFFDCTVLSEVRFSTSVSEIGSKAFDGCSKLLYIDIPYAAVTIDPEAFPTNHVIWLRGFREKGNGLDEYLNKRNNIKFIAYSDTTKDLFKCEYHCLTTVNAEKVTFTSSNKSTVISDKGVQAGTRIYVGITTSTNVRLKAGSLRCNGTPIGKDKDGEYTFTMPVGGAYVTAEYERTGKDENKYIIGSAKDVDFSLSNGTEIKSEEDTYSKTYELKVGQTAKMFLIDTSVGADNSIIESSKITFTSSDSTTATVSADGTIKTIKKGMAVITAKVSDRNGIATSRQAIIRISDADVYLLRLKPVSYDTSIVDVDKDSNAEITGLSLRKADVGSKETSFTLIATAYDKDGDNMSVALKWSSSDSKVAKLAKSTTKDAESQNVITIPKGASGNATITVTATNKDPIEAEKQVVKKFVVSVMDSTPRLSASSLTINPYQNSGAALEIIGAYDNKDINGAEVYLRSASDNDVQSDAFRIHKDESVGNSTYVRYIIRSVTDNMEDGAYPVSVHIEVSGNVYDLPLTINVKRFQPNPKVTFAKNQAKINLFYKNDGTQVVPVVSNLGNAKIESYRLENLSNSGDDLYFAGNVNNNGDIVGNFQIEDPTTGVITRCSEKMHYTSKNKPVVTGYLVLTFQDYKESFKEKRYKITIPTKTTKPVYKLSRTSDTFSLMAGKQEGVTLELLDNKKNPVNLNDEETDDYWEIAMDSTSTSSAVASNTVQITDDGKITMDVHPGGSAGTVVFAIHNSTWDKSQDLKYKYTVKISPNNPTFKLSKPTLSMNKHFTGYTETVTIIPNQYGVQIEEPDLEIPNYNTLSEDKKEQYDRISVNLNGNKIEVAINDSEIKNGTYKYIVYPVGKSGNKVVLNVKVTGNVPTMTIKGSAALNRNADTADKAILTLNPKNCPSDSTVDAVEVECTSNEGAEEYFDFDIIESNKLKVSLKNSVNVDNKTYTFNLTPTISGSDTTNPARLRVKVYSKTISVSLKAKGKINLLERNDGSGDSGNPTPDPTPDPETTKAVPVKYERNSTHIDSVKIKSGEGAEKDATENDTTVIYDSNKKLKENFVITATAKTDYKIKSIKAYNTGDKGTDWTGATAIASASVEAEGVNATLTIPANSTLTDAGITIVIESEEKGTTEPTNPTGYEVTLTKPDGVGRLEYAAINASDTVNADTNINTPYSAPINVDTGKKLAIKVTPDAGYEIQSVTASTGEGEEKTPINITPVADLKNVYETGEITSAVTISIEVKRIDYTITITDTTSEVVKKVEYKIGTDADTDYSDYSDVSELKAKYGEKLALQITVDETKLSDKELVVKYTEGTDAALEKLELQESEPDAGAKVYNCAIATVTGNIQIIISAEESTEEDENTNTVHFVKNGSHATIKLSSDADDEIVSGDTDTFETGDGYTFIVNTGVGYGVDVKVYKMDESDEAGEEGKLPGSEIEYTKDDSTYTISKESIGDTTDIVIVVTDIYTITITNEADPAVSAVKCKVGDASDYTAYDSDNKPTVSYGDAFSFTFTQAQDASVDVKSGVTSISPDEDKQDGNPVYSIAAIDDNVVITISPKNNDDTEDEGDAEVNGNNEEVQVNSNNNPMAQMNYSSKLTTYADDDDAEPCKWTVKNSIIYTPVVSNLKDTVIDARIFDDSGKTPNLSDDNRENDSKYFNIDVIDGLLYVTPKPDVEEEKIYLYNNYIYSLKIWLKFENYQPDPELYDGGVWVNKGITIKTAQILPKVTTDTNTINLYQSNPDYEATFVVRLKEGSVGKFKDGEAAISFGDKDVKAKESLECVTYVEDDGSLIVTISLKDGALYATNSTNKVKMYIQYENQAYNTLSTGTSITMNVRVNG